jgi:hypothetical protein
VPEFVLVTEPRIEPELGLGLEFEPVTELVTGLVFDPELATGPVPETVIGAVLEAAIEFAFETAFEVVSFLSSIVYNNLHHNSSPCIFVIYDVFDRMNRRSMTF